MQLCHYVYTRCWKMLYHFLHFLSQLLLFSDHGDHVLVHGWGQNHAECICFCGHVAHHLIMRKHVVPMQHAVVVNTLSAKRHLVEEKGAKES